MWPFSRDHISVVVAKNDHCMHRVHGKHYYRRLCGANVNEARIIERNMKVAGWTTLLTDAYGSFAFSASCPCFTT